MNRNNAVKVAMVVGATGATGQVLMQALLTGNDYTEIIVLHYRPTSWANVPKVRQIILNFDRLSELETPHKVDTVFCCLGTTLKKAGSKQAFLRVDRDYVLALGDWAAVNGQPAFHLISSYGANVGSWAFYLRVKGETENELKNLGLSGLTIYQPSLLHGKRNEFRWLESVAFYAMSIIGSLPGCAMHRPTRIEALARCMYQQSLASSSGQRITTPVDIAAYE